MAERRDTDRELTIDCDVRSVVELPDGSVLSGVVADSSLGGARIAGSARGLGVGDQIHLVFVFLSEERAGYRCTVRHVDPAGESFGVEFTSEPQPIIVHDH